MLVCAWFLVGLITMFMLNVTGFGINGKEAQHLLDKCQLLWTKCSTYETWARLNFRRSDWFGCCDITWFQEAQATKVAGYHSCFPKKGRPSALDQIKSSDCLDGCFPTLRSLIIMVLYQKAILHAFDPGQPGSPSRKISWSWRLSCLTMWQKSRKSILMTPNVEF